MPHIDPGRLVRGDYSIYAFTSQIYKIVRFNCTEVSIRSLDSWDKEKHNHYDSKLEQSFSRARKVVLEKALCNHWDWFGSLTLDKSKYDRFNLSAFVKDFTQWLRNLRKKGFEISYLLVPEMHESGAWHLHGFFSGLPDLISFADWRNLGHKVPNKLVRQSFYNWPAYQEKFGFCSFGQIKSPTRSAFYISKYITKDRGSMVQNLGSKLYYCSQGLNKAVLHNEVYGRSDELDEFLTHHYEFCSVGMTKISDGCQWHFSFDIFDSFAELQPLFPNLSPGSFTEQMAALQFEQDSFF